MSVEVDLLAPTSTGNESEKHGGVHITATVSCFAPTGVEMEALTAASIAGLAMFDMCKGVDRGMVIGEVRVLEKRGGKSGDWVWDGGVKSEGAVGVSGKGWRKSRDAAGREGEGHSGEYDWDWD